MSNSTAKLRRTRTPTRSPRRIDRERRAADHLAAAYDDPVVKELREAAITATLALDGTDGPELKERLQRRRTAVTALANVLRSRASDFVRLEPDLEGRVNGLVWAEVFVGERPDLDPAAIAELVRRLAPGTFNPDGAPKRIEISSAEAFKAGYEQARQVLRQSGRRPTQEAFAEQMSMSTDTLYRMRKDSGIA
jgi:hypothetical protein